MRKHGCSCCGEVEGATRHPVVGFLCPECREIACYTLPKCRKPGRKAENEGIFKCFCRFLGKIGFKTGIFG